MRRTIGFLILGIVNLTLPTTLRAGTPGEETPIVGTIQKIDPAERRVTIETRDGQLKRFELAKVAQLRQADRPATLDQFKTGQRVRVVYYNRASGLQAVTMDSVASNGEEFQREMKDVLSAAKNYSYEKKDEYRARLGRLADQMDDRIADLQSQARIASGEAKEQLQQTATDLRAREKVLRQQMQRVGASSADAWSDIRAGAGSALEEMQDSLRKAWKRLR